MSRGRTDGGTNSERGTDGRNLEETDRGRTGRRRGRKKKLEQRGDRWDGGTTQGTDGRLLRNYELGNAGHGRTDDKVETRNWSNEGRASGGRVVEQTQ